MSKVNIKFKLFSFIILFMSVMLCLAGLSFFSINKKAFAATEIINAEYVDALPTYTITPTFQLYYNSVSYTVTRSYGGDTVSSTQTGSDSTYVTNSIEEFITTYGDTNVRLVVEGNFLSESITLPESKTTNYYFHGVMESKNVEISSYYVNERGDQVFFDSVDLPTHFFNSPNTTSKFYIIDSGYNNHGEPAKLTTTFNTTYQTPALNNIVGFDVVGSAYVIRSSIRFVTASVKINSTGTKVSFSAINEEHDDYNNIGGLFVSYDSYLGRGDANAYKTAGNYTYSYPVEKAPFLEISKSSFRSVDLLGYGSYDTNQAFIDGMRFSLVEDGYFDDANTTCKTQYGTRATDYWISTTTYSHTIETFAQTDIINVYKPGYEVYLTIKSNLATPGTVNIFLPDDYINASVADIQNDAVKAKTNIKGAFLNQEVEGNMLASLEFNTTSASSSCKYRVYYEEENIGGYAIEWDPRGNISDYYYNNLNDYEKSQLDKFYTTISYAPNNTFKTGTVSSNTPADLDVAPAEVPGYKFNGWFIYKDNGDGTGQEESVDDDFKFNDDWNKNRIYARWIVESYNIEFTNLEGSTVVANNKSYASKIGKFITLPTASNITGKPTDLYFAGWKVDGSDEVLTEYFVTYDNYNCLSFEAVWREKVTLTFISEYEGTTNLPGERQVVQGETVTVSAKPQLRGYTFEYWKDQSTGLEFDFSKPIWYDTTLVAVFERNVVTITFEHTTIRDGYTDEAATLPSTITCYQYEIVDEPTRPTLEHFNFNAWSNKETSQAFNWEVGVEESVTLVAFWTPKSYSVQYVVTMSGVTVTSTNLTIYDVGTTLEMPVYSDLSGMDLHYDFFGCSLTNNLDEVVESVEITLENLKNLKVYVHVDLKTYILYFYKNTVDENATVWPDNISAKAHTSISKPADPVMEGYRFEYWYWENVDTPFTFPYEILSDKSIFAKWTLLTYDITYNLVQPGVTLKSEVATTITVQNLGTLYLPDSDDLNMDSVEHYTFMGWSTEQNGETGVQTFNVTKENYKTLTFWAVWSTKAYSVTFVHSSLDASATGWPSNMSVDALTSINCNATPSVTGYTFIGWFDASDIEETILTFPITATRNYEIKAKWEVIVTNITYVLQFNGYSLKTTGYTTGITIEMIGETIDFPTVNDMVTRPADHSLSGWSLTQDGEVEEDFEITSTNYNTPLTFYGIWVVREFKVNLILKETSTAVEYNNRYDIDYNSKLNKVVFDNFEEEYEEVGTQGILRFSSSEIGKTISLPNVYDLFIYDNDNVSGDSRVVVNWYAVVANGKVDLENGVALTREILSQCADENDVVTIMPKIEMGTLQPWFRTNGVQYTEKVDAEQIGNTEVDAVVFKKENGEYKLFQIIESKDMTFDGSYYHKFNIDTSSLEIGSYDFMLLLVEKDAVANITTITSYDDLLGVRKQIYEDTVPITKKNVYTFLTDPYFTLEYEYNGKQQVPQMKDVEQYINTEEYPVSIFNIVATPKKNAGYYTFTFELLDTTHYELQLSLPECNWQITQLVLDRPQNSKLYILEKAYNPQASNQKLTVEEAFSVEIAAKKEYDTANSTTTADDYISMLNSVLTIYDTNNNIRPDYEYNAYVRISDTTNVIWSTASASLGGGSGSNTEWLIKYRVLPLVIPQPIFIFKGLPQGDLTIALSEFDKNYADYVIENPELKFVLDREYSVVVQIADEYADYIEIEGSINMVCGDGFVSFNYTAVSTKNSEFIAFDGMEHSTYSLKWQIAPEEIVLSANPQFVNGEWVHNINLPDMLVNVIIWNMSLMDGGIGMDSDISSYDGKMPKLKEGENVLQYDVGFVEYGNNERYQFVYDNTRYPEYAHRRDIGFMIINVAAQTPETPTTPSEPTTNPDNNNENSSNPEDNSNGGGMGIIIGVAAGAAVVIGGGATTAVVIRKKKRRLK